MMKKLMLLIFLATGLIIVGCGLLDGDKEVTFKNPVYANVFFEKTHKDGAPVHGIVAINYDNPKEFKLLASGKSAYNNLRFSPDGEKLIYTDEYETGLGSAPQYGMYNTKTGKKELLHHILEGDKVELIGHENIDVVWKKNGSGFYYTNPAQAFSGTKSIFYYNIKTQKVDVIKDSPPKAIYPHDLISSDTLIVFSNEFEKLEFYLMGADGTYLQKINNPNIESINEGGITKKGVFDLAWNDSLGLLTAGYINVDKFGGYKIIITDLEGTIFKEFANGNYLNSNPIWTEDGNIIFTQRRNLYNNQIESVLKKTDLETGNITSFFSSREYPKITGIGTSDQ